MIIELMGKGGSLDVFGSVKGGMCQAVLVESRLNFHLRCFWLALSPLILCKKTASKPN